MATSCDEGQRRLHVASCSTQLDVDAPHGANCNAQGQQRFSGQQVPQCRIVTVFGGLRRVRGWCCRIRNLGLVVKARVARRVFLVISSLVAAKFGLLGWQ